MVWRAVLRIWPTDLNPLTSSRPPVPTPVNRCTSNTARLLVLWWKTLVGCFVSVSLLHSLIRDEFQQHDAGQCRSITEWSGMHQWQLGNSNKYAICVHWPRSQTPVPMVAETHADGKLDSINRCNGTFQSCLFQASHFALCSQTNTQSLFLDLLEATSDALANLKFFVLNLGTPKKLSQGSAKVFISEQFKRHCLDAAILQETPQHNGLTERYNKTWQEMLAHWIRTSQIVWDEKMPRRDDESSETCFLVA